MIRVLHITHWYPSDEKPTSGCFILDQCHAVQQEEHTTSFVLFFDILHPRKIFPTLSCFDLVTEGGLHVTVFKFQWILSPVLYILPQLQWLFFKRKVKKIILATQPDIIHGHVIHPSGELAAKIARVFSLPMVISEHWSNLQSYFSKKLLSVWGVKAYHQARYIFPVSGFLGKTILGIVKELDPEKVVIVPNVVASNVFFYAERDEPNENLKFIMVSYWMRHKQVTKRPELVFEALNQFVKESRQIITLTVVGGGDMLSDLKSIATMMDFEVIFSGSLQREEIAELFRSHDYFLHASNIETFSLVTAEALMCGLPAVVSNTGALPDLVTNERGVIADNEVSAWVEAIHKITTTTYNRQEIAHNVAKLCAAGEIGQRIRDRYDAALNVD